jgi:hypothetical protein
LNWNFICWDIPPWCLQIDGTQVEHHGTAGRPLPGDEFGGATQAGFLGFREMSIMEHHWGLEDSHISDE